MKYQIKVHGDDEASLTPPRFSDFLVSSTLFDDRNGKKARNPTCADEMEYGTYHQLYRVNGRLVAVGVADILPGGLSSVYCFYDPDLPKLSLGRYTALKEIEFCQNMGFKYYYMGFYIHSCQKMRYKGEFAPSELLCFTSNKWFPLEECTPLLDKHRFSPFDPVLALQWNEHCLRSALAMELAISRNEAKDGSEAQEKGKEKAEKERDRDKATVRRKSTGAARRDGLDSDNFKTDHYSTGSLSPTDAKRLAVMRVPIGLGDPIRVLSVRDINEGGRKQLQRILEGWVDEVGPELSRELILKF